MRIIRGIHKGRKIILPKGFNARPTTDFAKEALFNILLNNYSIQNAVVLDLFAGTGSISYEFLSEGCESVTSVDISKQYIFHIKKQGEELFSGKLKAVCADAFRFCNNNILNYDIIFADPPYRNEKIAKLPDLIFKNSEIKEDVLFILEHSKNFSFSDNVFFKEKRTYGNVNFSFFEKR